MYNMSLLLNNVLNIFWLSNFLCCIHPAIMQFDKHSIFWETQKVNALQLVVIELACHVNFHLCMICMMIYHTSPQPWFVCSPRRKNLKAVQIITRKQDGNGVQLKLHQMTDTFPGIGESVQILMFATLMKVPKWICFEGWGSKNKSLGK